MFVSKSYILTKSRKECKGNKRVSVKRMEQITQGQEF